MRRRGDEAEDWDGQSRRRPAPTEVTRRVHLPDAVPAVPLSEWAVGTASGRTLPQLRPHHRKTGERLIVKSTLKNFSTLAGVRPPERKPEGEVLPPKGRRSAPEAGLRLSGKAALPCSWEQMF